MSYIIKENGVFVLHTRDGASILKKSDMRAEALRYNIIWADLSNHGLEIVYILDSWSLEIEVNATKLDIYRIRHKQLVLKNSRLFGLDLSADYRRVFSQYTDLKQLVYDLLGRTIYDRSVYSLASVSALLIKKHCRWCLRHNNSDLDTLIRANFYGGRRQQFKGAGGSL